MGLNLQKSNKRITPAYAGKSFLSTSRAFCNQDHPRLCGEKSRDAVHPPCRAGITPAYAGKSTMPVQTARGMWDHPRLCGEKLNFTFPVVFIIGSPPPMRGKVRTMWKKTVSCRITPAYAGKSTRNAPYHKQLQDHPRLCGEKDACKWCIYGSAGSPPPMRGKA